MCARTPHCSHPAPPRAGGGRTTNCGIDDRRGAQHSDLLHQLWRRLRQLVLYAGDRFDGQRPDAAADQTLDILVNCAGRIDFGLIAATPWEVMAKAMDVNLGGAYRGIKACMPLLLKREADAPWASVVNIASMASYGGVPFSSSYAASKAALTSFTKTAALEFAKLGQHIRVNSVHPATIDTPMVAGTDRAVAGLLGVDPEDVRREAIARHPIGRIGCVDDVVYGVLDLADELASFTTGYDLKVGGGREL